MFMKTQLPVARGRSVAARAVHGQQAVQTKTAAVLVGAALQIAVLGQAADAVSLSLEKPQNAVEEPANKVESLLDGAGKEIKKVTEQFDVASAPQAIDQAVSRAAQEKNKADEAADALSKAGTAVEQTADDLSQKAAQAKAAAEEATADRIAAVKDAAGKFGPAKAEAQKLVSQKEEAESKALKKAADAKSAAENAVADAVASN